MTDLRARLTRQIVKTLEAGRPVVVVGGPGMGKSYLAQQVGKARPRTLVEDGASPDCLTHVGMGNEPRLITLGIEAYDASQTVRDKALWVPLTNLVPRIFRQQWDSGDHLWGQSAGHPGLATALRSGPVPFPTESARTTLAALLRTHPTCALIANALADLPPELSAADRYAQLDHRWPRRLRPALDRLACAGLVTRMIDGTRPGLWRTPIELPFP